MLIKSISTMDFMAYFLAMEISPDELGTRAAPDPCSRKGADGVDLGL
jgi:hypothetical protein